MATMPFFFFFYFFSLFRGSLGRTSLCGGSLAAPRSSSTRSSTVFFSVLLDIFFCLSFFLCLALCVTP